MLLSLLSPLLVACAAHTPPGSADQLRADLAACQEQLAATRAENEALRAGAPAPHTPEEEAAAAELARRASDALEVWDGATARAAMEEIQQKYPGTRAAGAAARMLPELALWGQPAPAIQVERWFQGETTLAASRATLLVFWEVWCPHCQREVPALQATYERYKDRGLQVVALTRITRSATPEAVQAFIVDHGLTFPVGKETGEASEAYAVTGIPAAALIVDGKIVFRGHPMRITEERLAAALQE